MRLSKNQKKILIVLLRHKKGEIPNLVLTPRYKRTLDEKHKGLDNAEISYYVEGCGWYRWTYQRSLETLKKEGLVNCEHRSYKKSKNDYFLTDKGTEITEKIKKEMEEIIGEWDRVINYKAEDLKPIK